MSREGSAMLRNLRKWGTLWPGVLAALGLWPDGTTINAQSPAPATATASGPECPPPPTHLPAPQELRQAVGPASCTLPDGPVSLEQLLTIAVQNSPDLVAARA